MANNQPDYSFGGEQERVSDPLNGFETVSVAGGDVDFGANIPRAILIGTAGDLVVRGRLDTADVTLKLAAGWHPIRPKIIRQTGTTAANIVAGF